MSTRKQQKRPAPRTRAAPPAKPYPRPAAKADPKAKAGVDIARLFHALGDPTRRAMLDRLTHGPMSVSALADPLAITLTAVTQHLQILEECALVHTEKLGRVRTCRINPAGFDALDRWVKDHRTIWEQRLGRLATLLDEPDAG